MIVVPIALMLPLSIVGSRFAPRVYEAKTILLLQETGKDNPFLKDFAVGLNLKDRIQALQVLVKSEHVLLNVLRDISGGNAPTDSADQAFQIRQLASNISVQLTGTDLIELKLKGTQPQGLGKKLSAISARFLERLLSPEQSTLGATQGFLKAQLDARQAVLEETEREFAEFKVKNATQLQASQIANMTRLNTLQQKLQEKAMDLSSAVATLSEMRNQLAGSNPIVSKLEDAIVQVTAELTTLRTRYTTEHSEVQAAERKLQRLQEERRTYIEVARSIGQLELEDLWKVASTPVVEGQKAPPPLLVSQIQRLQEAHSRRIALENDISQLKVAVSALQVTVAEYAPVEQQQSRLEKRLAAAREAYEVFVKRYDNASTSRALGLFEAPERVKVIDAPQDPSIPVTPPPFIYIIAGVVAGVGLGLGMAVVAEILDPYVRIPVDFIAITGLPVMARLPRARGAQNDAPAPRPPTIDARMQRSA